MQFFLSSVIWLIVIRQLSYTVYQRLRCQFHSSRLPCPLFAGAFQEIGELCHAVGGVTEYDVCHAVGISLWGIVAEGETLTG